MPATFVPEYKWLTQECRKMPTGVETRLLDPLWNNFDE